jgi:hypothetical protein
MADDNKTNIISFAKHANTRADLGEPADLSKLSLRALLDAIEAQGFEGEAGPLENSTAGGIGQASDPGPAGQGVAGPGQLLDQDGSRPGSVAGLVDVSRWRLQHQQHAVAAELQIFPHHLRNVAERRGEFPERLQQARVRRAVRRVLCAVRELH